MRGGLPGRRGACQAPAQSWRVGRVVTAHEGPRAPPPHLVQVLGQAVKMSSAGGTTIAGCWACRWRRRLARSLAAAGRSIAALCWPPKPLLPALCPKQPPCAPNSHPAPPPRPLAEPAAGGGAGVGARHGGGPARRAAAGHARHAPPAGLRPAPGGPGGLPPQQLRIQLFRAPCHLAGRSPRAPPCCLVASSCTKKSSPPGMRAGRRAARLPRG